jgi:cytochrome bd-type quinol oxidase subunit 2
MARQKSAEAGKITYPAAVLLKLVALFVFMVATLVAALWITVELAGAVAEGSDDVWYLAVALTLAAALLILIVLLRGRTRAMVGFLAAATVVLAAVLVTYPDGGPSCTPTEAQPQGQATTSADESGAGDIFETVDDTATNAAATDCS